MRKPAVRAIRLMFVLAALLTVCASPAVASAKVLEYQLQYLPVGTNGVSQLIIDVVLDPSTKLPVTVKVPMPMGAKLLWTGEILGTESSADPAREATVTVADGAQLVQFTMSQSWVGQVEADYTAPIVSGDDVSSRLVWVNVADSVPLVPSVRLEPGVSAVKIMPQPSGEASSNAAGEMLYSLAQTTLATGKSYTIDVSYSRSAAFNSVGSTSSTIITLALVLLGIAMIILVFVIILQRNRQRDSQAS